MKGVRIQFMVVSRRRTEVHPPEAFDAVIPAETDRIRQLYGAGVVRQIWLRTDAPAHPDDALNLLGNCADIYARCDDANRRLCNQVFFTRVYVEEYDELRVENARPFEMLLDPAVNTDALTLAANVDEARTPAVDFSDQGSGLVRGVPPAGFEPALQRV